MQLIGKISGVLKFAVPKLLHVPKAREQKCLSNSNWMFKDEKET